MMSKKKPLEPEDIMAIDDAEEMMREMACQWMLGGLPREIFGVASLFFKCEHCGECCTTFDDIAINKREIERLAEHLGISAEEFQNRYTKELMRDRDDEKIMEFGERHGYVSLSVPCPFHTNEGCSVYEFRPKSCAIFPCFSSLQGVDPISGAIILDPTCEALRKCLDWIMKNKKIAFRKESEFLDKILGD